LDRPVIDLKVPSNSPSTSWTCESVFKIENQNHSVQTEADINTKTSHQGLGANLKERWGAGVDTTHDSIPVSFSQESNRSFSATDYTAIRKELGNSAFRKGLIDVAFITP